MQGPNALLNVVTIPPGAGPLDPRVVINGPSGEIDVYGTGGKLVIVISSNLEAILVYG